MSTSDQWLLVFGVEPALVPCGIGCSSLGHRLGFWVDPPALLEGLRAVGLVELGLVWVEGVSALVLLGEGRPGKGAGTALRIAFSFRMNTWRFWEYLSS